MGGKAGRVRLFDKVKKAASDAIKEEAGELFKQGRQELKDAAIRAGKKAAGKVIADRRNKPGKPGHTLDGAYERAHAQVSEQDAAPRQGVDDAGLTSDNLKVATVQDDMRPESGAAPEHQHEDPKHQVAAPPQGVDQRVAQELPATATALAPPAQPNVQAGMKSALKEKAGHTLRIVGTAAAKVAQEVVVDVLTVTHEERDSTSGGDIEDKPKVKITRSPATETQPEATAKARPEVAIEAQPEAATEDQHSPSGSDNSGGEHAGVVTPDLEDNLNRLKEWWNKAADTVNEKIDEVAGVLKVPEALRGYVDLDIKNRRVFISNATLLKMADAAAAQADDVEVQEISTTGEGYDCRVSVKGTTVESVLIPKQVIWDDGKLTAKFETPDGLALKDRPILGFFLRFIIALFGGTAFGEMILSLKLPP